MRMIKLIKLIGFELSINSYLLISINIFVKYERWKRKAEFFVLEALYKPGTLTTTAKTSLLLLKKLSKSKLLLNLRTRSEITSLLP
jgi:hypothetical protein